MTNICNAATNYGHLTVSKGFSASKEITTSVLPEGEEEWIIPSKRQISVKEWQFQIAS